MSHFSELDSTLVSSELVESQGSAVDTVAGVRDVDQLWRRSRGESRGLGLLVWPPLWKRTCLEVGITLVWYNPNGNGYS